MSNNEKSTRDLCAAFPPGLSEFCLPPFGEIPCLGISAIEYHDGGLFQSVVFEPETRPLDVTDFLHALCKASAMFQDINALAVWLYMPSGEVVNTGYFPFEKFFSGDYAADILDRLTLLRHG